MDANIQIVKNEMQKVWDYIRYDALAEFDDTESLAEMILNTYTMYADNVDAYRELPAQIKIDLAIETVEKNR